MTSLQQETIKSELATVALRLKKLRRKFPMYSPIRANAEIRLARIKSVLNLFTVSQ